MDIVLNNLFCYFSFFYYVAILQNFLFISCLLFNCLIYIYLFIILILFYLFCFFITVFYKYYYVIFILFYLTWYDFFKIVEFVHEPKCLGTFLFSSLSLTLITCLIYAIFIFLSRFDLLFTFLSYLLFNFILFYLILHFIVYIYDK